MLTVLTVFPACLFAQKDTSSIKLNEVIISAGRVEQTIKQLPVSISVLSKEDINTKSLNSIDDVLKTTVGINVVRPLGIYGKSK